MEIQWALVLFTAIAGAGAFAFVFVCIDELRGHDIGNKAIYVSTVVALVLMAVGGCISATHIIYHLDRIMAVLTHPAQGIFMEALMVGIVMAIAVVYGILVYRGIGGAARKAVAAAGAAFGIAFTFFCGYSYMMGSRPAWDVILLPIGYTGTVVVAGAGVYLLVCALCKCRAETIRSASLYVVVGAAIALVTGCAFGFYSGEATGSTAALFWIVVVLVNGIAPGLAGLYVYRKGAEAVPMGIVSAAGGLIGSSGYRVAMWVVGTAVANYFGVML